MSHPHAGILDPAAYPATPFPAADWQWFCDRCAALGVPDPAPWRQRFEALYAHLVGVNAWFNLTRLTGLREYLKWHLLDSLSILALPEMQGLRAEETCLDLGSGGGYPGLPLMCSLPGLPWTLVDSRRRKVDFLTAAIPLTGAHEADARHFRGRESAAAAPDLHDSCQLVIARAVGPLARILPEAAGLLARGGLFLAMKGPRFVDEQAESDRQMHAMSFAYEATREIVLEDGDPVRVVVALRKT